MKPLPRRHTPGPSSSAMTGSSYGGGLLTNPASPAERTCSWLTHISWASHTTGPPNPCSWHHSAGLAVSPVRCPLQPGEHSSGVLAIGDAPVQARGSSGPGGGGGQHGPADPRAWGCPWQAPLSTSGPWCPCPAPGQALKATGARPSFRPSPGSSEGPAGLSLAPDFWSQTAPPPTPGSFVPVQDAPGWPLDPDCLLWGQLGHIRGKAMPDPGQSTWWVLGPASLRTNQATLRYSPTSPSNGRGTAHFLGLWN